MIKLFEKLHIPLWITKDMFWMLGYGTASLSFAIPTILLSIILIILKNKSERWLEVMMTFWLSANTLWMTYELFQMNTKHLALICFLLGILTIPIYLLKIKDE